MNIKSNMKGVGFMDSGKKLFGGWWLWILGLLILTIVVLFALNSVGMIGKTVVERKVFENSYQKSESDKTAKTIYDAQLALLRAKLSSPNLDDGTKADIRAQIDSINILKSTKED